MSKRPAFAVIFAALVARAIIWLLIDPAADPSGGDSAYFLSVARSIASGGGYALGGVPTILHPPAYPVFLAFAPVPLLLQSLLTVAVALLAARRLSLPAAILYVACPFIIVFEWRYLAEALAINLTVAAFLLVAFPRRSWEPFLGGILMGLAILTRDTLQFLPILLLAIAWFDRANLKRVFLAVVVAYLTVLPWQIRNGGPISEGRIGVNLWVGTWERSPDWIDAGFKRAQFPPEAFRNDVERQRLMLALAEKDDQRFFKTAIDRMLTEPLATLGNWAVRYPRLWLGTRTEQVSLRAERNSLLWTAEKAGFYLLNLLMLLAGLAGMILAVRSDRRWAYAAAPILFIALAYVPFHNTEPRYSLPAVPFLLAFAAIGYPLLSERLRRRSVRAHEGRRSAP